MQIVHTTSSAIENGTHNVSTALERVPCQHYMQENNAHAYKVYHILK